MKSTRPLLLAVAFVCLPAIALAAKPAQLHDRIPAAGTTPSGYVTWYSDDNPGPPPDADYMSAADANDAHDSLESSHARFILYGFDAPEFSAAPSETYIYSCGDGGWAPHDSIWLDSPDNRGGPEPWIRSTMLHELFHHVQYNYIVFNQWQAWGRWNIEGTARLMEDKTFLDLDTDFANTRYLGQVNNYLGNPSRPLLDLSYSSCLFWNYLTEQYGANPADFSVGTEVIRTFWERCDGHAPDGMKYLNETIAHFEPGKQLSDIFIDFLIANYTKDLDVSGLPNGGRYTYIDDNDTDAGGNPLLYGAVVRTSHALPPNVVNQPDNVPRWAGKWYDATVPANAQIVGFQAKSTNGKPLTAAAVSVKGPASPGSPNRVSQIFRSNGQDFAIAFFSRTGDRIMSIVGVVGGLDDDVTFQYTIAAGDAKLVIQSPTHTHPAYVGTKTEPERFVAKVSVMGLTELGDPSVRGLHYTDFTARVGLEDAEILNGTYVQGDYWLLIQAPDQTAAGEEFNLSVTLGTVTTTREGAVIYRKIVRDQVMLIDGSGSMLDDGKIDAAKNAASLLVDTKADGDMLGVVRFHGNGIEPDVDATVEFALSNVNDISREDAKQEIEDIIIPGGWVTTGLGDGVNVSQDQLDTRGRPDDQHIIVLLSDGMENESLFWSDVEPDILAKGTVIHTVALGPGDHHTLMESIANDTGGEYYYVTTTVTGALAPAGEPLPNVLADVYKQIEEEIAGHQRLWYAKAQIPAGGKTQHSYELTENGAEDGVIAVNWDKPGDQLDVVLEDPDGNLIKPTTPGIQYFEAETHVVYRLPKMIPGKWTIYIESLKGGPTDYVASISARILHGVDLDVYIRQEYTSRWVGLPVQIVANLSDYKGPLPDASVVATVHHPNGTAYRVKLRDDGNHNDAGADDGIYANEFTRTTERGSYVVEVRARGKSHFGEPFERVKNRAFSVRYNEKEGDVDRDGMPDAWERLHGLIVGEDDSAEDKDGDGVSNIEEFLAGTDPNNPDTDGGGESDFSELKRGSDPCDEDDDLLPRPSDVGVVRELTCPDGAKGPLEPNTNLIYFPVNPAYRSLLLFRHKGPFVSPREFDLVDEIDPAKYQGLYPDKGLGDGIEYFYFLVANGSSGAQSGRSPIFSGIARNDPFPPIGSVQINNGDWRTTSLDVTLTLEASPDTTHLMVSNDPSFKGVLWAPKPDSMPWTLAPVPGTKYATVYALFRDAAGNVSIVEHDTVFVDLDEDADDDRILDWLDFDDDNDWLPDFFERWVTLDPFRFDSDGDGMPDGDEDTDGDWQSNLTELVGGSDPGDPGSLFRGAIGGMAADKILIQWPYIPGRRYRLLGAEDPKGRWEPVPGEYKVDGDIAYQEDTIVRLRLKFYRVEVFFIPPDFNAITKDDISSAPLSSDSINGSDRVNRLTPGSIILCETSQGRFCKFLIEDFGPAPSHTLTIRWVTYEPDGSVHSQGSGLKVRGSWMCDLNEGFETLIDADFWWRQDTLTTRFLIPQNGATFYKAW